MNRFITDFIEGFKMVWENVQAFAANPLWLGSLGKKMGNRTWTGGKFAKNNPRTAGILGAGLIAGLGGTVADDAAQYLSAGNLENGVIPFQDLIAEELALRDKREGAKPVGATYADLKQEDIDHFKSLMSDKTDLTEDFSWVSGLGGQKGDGYNLAWDRFMGNPAKATNYAYGRDIYFNHANDGWMERGYKPLIGTDALFKANGDKESALKAMQEYLDTVNYIIERGENFDDYRGQADFFKEFATNDGHVSLEGRKKIYDIIEQALLDKANGVPSRKATPTPIDDGESPEDRKARLQRLRDL